MRVRGIVKPGSGGGSGNRDGSWVLSLSLRPWRDPEGRLVDGEATLWRWYPDDASFRRGRREIPADGAIVELDVSAPERIRGLEFRERGATELEWSRWTPADDPELVRFAARTEPRAEIVDAELGTFIRDARLDWYSAPRLAPDGSAYDVNVGPELRGLGPEAIAAVRAVVARFEAALPAIRAAVADELYDLWLGTWRDEEEDPELSRDAFAARLPLQSIVWYAENGEAELTAWFGDDGLFGHHGIEVWIRDGVVQSANLAG